MRQNTKHKKKEMQEAQSNGVGAPAYVQSIGGAVARGLDLICPAVYSHLDAQ